MGGPLMTRVTAKAAALQLPAGTLRRALMGGSAWGVVMGAVITAVSAWTCGVICIPDAMLTTALAIAAGICTIGPLAAFAPHAR
jgi:hypothetical protein